ncbi:MAG: CinA family protein [Candidatus Thioglobus sp.]|mgnify:CR=1 FL=1|jgi:nicotinamide-nucleotide amidase|nr:CinA family protein [Candidatus Thioglobus sp.]
MNKLQAIKAKLVNKGYRISVAESLSSGNIQSRIGSIPGATQFFEGGVTVYSLEQKAKLLNVDKIHAEVVDSVSERVAREMALGVCELFNTQIGISTTGYAEPSEEMGVEQPFAFFSIWNNVAKIELENQRVILDRGSRIGNQEMITEVVIDQLARILGEM